MKGDFEKPEWRFCFPTSNVCAFISFFIGRLCVQYFFQAPESLTFQHSWGYFATCCFGMHLMHNWHRFLHFHFHGNGQRYFRKLKWKIPIRVDAAIVRIHWIRVKKQGQRGQVSLKVGVSGLSPKNLLSAWKIYKQFTLRDRVSFVICIALLTERGE